MHPISYLLVVSGWRQWQLEQLGASIPDDLTRQGVELDAGGLPKKLKACTVGPLLGGLQTVALGRQPLLVPINQPTRLARQNGFDLLNGDPLGSGDLDQTI